MTKKKKIRGLRKGDETMNEWMKRLRALKGETQLELALMLSYKTPQIVSNVENGIKRLPAHWVPILAGWAQVDPLWLHDWYYEELIEHRRSLIQESRKYKRQVRRLLSDR